MPPEQPTIAPVAPTMPADQPTIAPDASHQLVKQRSIPPTVEISRDAQPPRTAQQRGAQRDGGLRMGGHDVVHSV